MRYWSSQRLRTTGLNSKHYTGWGHPRPFYNKDNTLPMRKKDILEENARLLDERERMMRYIDRLERERYHLRGLMMIEALDEWFSESADEPDDEEPMPVTAEVKVKGFAPRNNDAIPAGDVR